MSTLFRLDKFSMRLKSWKTTPKFSLILCWFSCVIFSSLKYIDPVSGVFRPLILFSRVVFPDPLGPRRAMNSLHLPKHLHRLTLQCRRGRLFDLIKPEHFVLVDFLLTMDVIEAISQHPVTYRNQNLSLQCSVTFHHHNRRFYRIYGR